VGNDGMATQANGTGPFKLVEWRRGDSIIMERFADYYGGAPAIPPVGAAKADRLIFKIIPENASRMAALMAGEVDVVNEVPVFAINTIERSGKAKVVKANGTRTFFIALNVTKPPFSDVRSAPGRESCGRQETVDRSPAWQRGDTCGRSAEPRVVRLQKGIARVRVRSQQGEKAAR
jgi:hypothetical protein